MNFKNEIYVNSLSICLIYGKVMTIISVKRKRKLP